MGPAVSLLQLKGHRITLLDHGIPVQGSSRSLGGQHGPSFMSADGVEKLAFVPLDRAERFPHAGIMRHACLQG